MSDQLTCPLRGKKEQYALIDHLGSSHNVAPEVFQARFPEQPPCSSGFGAFLAERQVRKQDGVLHYELDVTGVQMMARHGVDHPLIAEPAPTFVWTEPCRDVAEAIEHNERVFLYGPSETGKSSLVRQIAAMVQRACPACLVERRDQRC